MPVPVSWRSVALRRPRDAVLAVLAEPDAELAVRPQDGGLHELAGALVLPPVAAHWGRREKGGRHADDEVHAVHGAVAMDGAVLGLVVFERGLEVGLRDVSQPTPPSRGLKSAEERGARGVVRQVFEAALLGGFPSPRPWLARRVRTSASGTLWHRTSAMCLSVVGEVSSMYVFRHPCCCPGLATRQMIVIV